MATTEKPKKRRLIKKSDQTKPPNIKPKKSKTTPSSKSPEELEQQDHHHRQDGIDDSDSESVSGSGSDSDSDSDSEKLSLLLEPYSKDQLIELICDAATKDSSLLHRIRDLADRDVCHRKIFVHGLSWDTSKEALVSAFEQFGKVEECNLVLDKNTGKAKGYGFVLFKTRRAAIKALKNPQKKIMNRMASCQLASLGPASSSSAAAAPTPSSAQDLPASRKIYVSNVPADTDVERFRAFFAKFGEIEAGPIGFDVQTGKSRGFALFVYRNQEGFKKALQEPYKLFEGHQLHCQKAAEGKNRNQAQAVAAANPSQAPPQPQVQPHQPPMMATPQNLGFYNPMMYGGFIPGAVNPMALNPGVIPASQFGSLAGGNSSVLGTYATNANAPLQPQVYPNVSQFGQSAASASRPQGAGGAVAGYPSSYTWYDKFLFGFFCFYFSRFS
ncbi:hypothetical protein TIFTF001_004240 [Ficus carica]|uniref:RRM domain-containing protein n=1 Tax=Ficus carica TaxID=3494 RepID=A0AA87ZHX2_FICCA|nr:hypothetical protein TIFTF001_004240 [Ficus carica]